MKNHIFLIAVLIGISACSKKKPATLGLEERLYTTAKYENCDDCDYNAINNLTGVARAYLWPLVKEPTIPDGYLRESCGGEPVCDEPLMAPKVKCSLKITDCDFGIPGEGREPKVLKTIFLECRGDIACSFENMKPEACCSIIGQTEY